MGAQSSLDWATIGAVVITVGCAPRTVPSPKQIAERYAEAVHRGDSSEVYALLSRDSQRGLGRSRVDQIMADSKKELLAQAQAIDSKQSETTTLATVKFVDGEVATLVVEDGRFRVTAASSLPAQASTPEQALGELRAVLARRSYAGLMGVLTNEAAHGLEDKLGSLVKALAEPDALEIQVNEDRAVVETPDGHRVELQRECGVWKIRNFE